MGTEHTERAPQDLSVRSSESTGADRHRYKDSRLQIEGMKDHKRNRSNEEGQGGGGEAGVVNSIVWGRGTF